MSRRTKHVVAAIMLAALLISAVVPALAAEATARPRVVVLLAPYLSWSDVTAETMPHLTELAGRSLVANMNVRAGKVLGGSSPESGALVLSAGAPIDVAPGALDAFDADEFVGNTRARDLYQQYFGFGRGMASVLYLGLPRQVAANAQTEYGNRMGALGQAVHAGGGHTAALGCGDPGYTIEPHLVSRPAALASADEQGQIDFGSVSRRMLVKDAVAPFGVTASVSVILERYLELMEGHEADLIVVDPGDLARSYSIASSITTAAADLARTQAVRTTDEIIGGLVEGLQPGDTIMVVAQAISPAGGGPAGYAPFVLGGTDAPSVGVAGSTHRDGIVTIYDVSATILSRLGIEQPTEMVGSVVKAAGILPGAGLQERVDYLTKVDATSVAVESVRGAIVNTFIVVAVIVLIIATLLIYRGPAGLPAWAFTAARAAVLLVECFLLGSLLQSVLWLRPPTGLMVLAMIFAGTAIAFGVVWFVGGTRLPAMRLLLALGGVSLAIMADQWAGAPLSFALVFGYSPLAGMRYFGMGNEMAGVLLGSVLMGTAVAIDMWRDRPVGAFLRRWGWPLVGLVTIATSSLPFWGANVGTVAWMTVAFLVGWMLLNGKRVWSWKNAILVLVLVAVAVAALAAIDLSGGAGTHLGRAVENVMRGGGSGFATMITRKAETNLRVLSSTNWTWMLVVVLLLLGYMRWRPHGEFAELLSENPSFSAALAAALFAGIVGFFTEDSGIIIPALMFVPVGVTALYLMLLRPHGGEVT